MRVAPPLLPYDDSRNDDTMTCDPASADCATAGPPDGRDERNELLERRVEELVALVAQLQEENRALRQRQDSMMTERATLLQKNEQVRARVEAMIGRLKAMEHGA